MSTKRTPHVAIVGSGLAGIATAIALKRQLQFDNFTIYEKDASLGGTWRDNTYPGCGSDIPGHWYSLSTELNPNFSAYFVGQPEILQYWKDLYTKHQLHKHTIYNTHVYSSQWDSNASLWHVELRDTNTGKRREIIDAEVIIYAIGGFQAPSFPKDFEGADLFRGPSWHSARWDHSVELSGKRIALIGNGCSAAQIVPEISKDSSVHVINFCRTPQWFVPRGNYKYPGVIKWMFSHMPFLLRWYRNSIMIRHDLSYLAFDKNFKWYMWIARRALTQYIKLTAPKGQLDHLVPGYSPGCKRIIVDPDYLKSLHRPNVELEWEVIDSVVENGINLKDGRFIPVDAIVYSTGFSLDPVDLRMTGINGASLREYFDQRGGPTCYFGSFVPHFPNAAVLLGPNVAPGHASVIFNEETQINLALKLFKPILEGKYKAFEVKEEVCDKYNQWLQTRLSNSVWTDCHSFYQSETSGKIIATFPGPVSLFWYMMRKVKLDDWNFIGGEDWVAESKRMVAQRRRFLFSTLSALLIVTVALRLSGKSPVSEWLPPTIRRAVS